MMVLHDGYSNNLLVFFNIGDTIDPNQNNNSISKKAALKELL